METKKLHSVCVENRNKAVLSGVENVISATETAVSLATSEGGLFISGKNLKIEKFDIEDGSLVISGEIDLMKYSGVKVPVLKRLFK